MPGIDSTSQSRWTTPRIYLLDCADAKLQPERRILAKFWLISFHSIMGSENPVHQMLAECGQRVTPLVISPCSYFTRKGYLIRKGQFYLAWLFFFVFAWVGGGGLSRGGVRIFVRYGGRPIWSSRCAVETHRGSTSPPGRKQSPQMGWRELIKFHSVCVCCGHFSLIHVLLVCCAIRKYSMSTLTGGY